jgi:rod shape-determining protein MreD
VILRRTALEIVVIAIAYLLQVSVLDRVSLPVGHPDLLVMVVVAFALVGGPQHGAIVGFATGLAADILPPSAHLLGRLAFAYTVVGYLAGLLEDAEEHSVLTTIFAVAAAAATAVIVYAGLGVLISDPDITARATVRSLIAVVVYDVLLAPFIVPLVAAASRRLEPAGPR